MWGLEELLEAQSAPDDYSLIFDKVQDTHARMANILEAAGFSKVKTEDLGGPLSQAHWQDPDSDVRHAHVNFTDPDLSNLITSVTVQTDSGVHTFILLSHQHYSDPNLVTGEIASTYIENLEELQDWLKAHLS